MLWSFMTDRLVAGVDFSGAKTVPNDTWLTVARVGNLGVEVTEVKHVGSHALAKELTAAHLAAVGIDCPFSLPASFIDFVAAKKLKSSYQSWQEIAQELVFIPFEEFEGMVKEFKKEPKRFCDTAIDAPAISPLHRGGPSMVQMTFAGMRLLAMLDPQKFFVLPFQDSIPFGCAVIEVYPRAMLKALALPDTGYKSQDKKDAEKMNKARATILDGMVNLREKKGITYSKYPRLSVPAKFRKAFTESDHALDSLIACYCTAVFIAEPSLFRDPLEADNLDVLLEGWIYNP
jgi:predicted nuclease with RNAse H fold